MTVTRDLLLHSKLQRERVTTIPVAQQRETAVFSRHASAVIGSLCILCALFRNFGICTSCSRGNRPPRKIAAIFARQPATTVLGGKTWNESRLGKLWAYLPLNIFSALSWPYILSATKPFWRGAPKTYGSDINRIMGSIHRYDQSISTNFRTTGGMKFVILFCIWNGVLTLEECHGGCLLLEAAQMSLSHVICRCQLRHHTPFFTDNLCVFQANQIRSIEQKRYNSCR